ncbi:anti-anti-sigma regulatory factor [Jeotgalibacillus malaysiensis]|uniref:Anti-anti-sigma regulatory factor n=1 Tax=Jeotgalibacillus malaysiensis TaxID=1508404 RepID=A0A0B5ANM5_9BACL|nr:STAS domain-containing protein [Jeotgalibacillus malaysiensis]AJD89609.1 anti-anti-sigma regulatory factor [Jeotgalibacillus malaysiensis]
MLKNQELHTYFYNKADALTEEWYSSLDRNKGGVYGSTDPIAIERIKNQNNAFHRQFCKVFQSDDQSHVEDFMEWIESIALDEAHQSTELEDIIEEFFRTQEQYLNLIEEYAQSCPKSLSYGEVMTWTKTVVNTISSIIHEFTVQHSKVAKNRLQAHQEMITEMSAPVISLTSHIGFLPLVGEITTHRAQIVFSKTLAQSSELQISKLFIDLSGVPIIDTMVAQQIFQLISGLKIIGVQTAISGISPLIAQTAIQLGLSFKDIEIYSTLAQAMKAEDFNS